MSPTHQSYLQAFLQHLKILGYKYHSGYKKAVTELINRTEVKGQTIHELSKTDLQNHYDYLLQRPHYRTGGALSQHTIRGYWFGLQLFFAFAEKMGWLISNPMSSLVYSFPTNSTRIALTTEQIQALYETSESEQDKAILALFYGCGLRRMEAERLNLSDLDFKSHLLYVRKGKGKKRRVIPITPAIRQDLKNYAYEQRPQQISKWTSLKDHKAYMLNKIGTRMLGYSYWKYFKEMVNRTDLPPSTTLHHLRHSIATHLLLGGMPLERVRDFLGHDFLETTQIYTHVDNKHDQ